jgi:hypothetical protein
VALERVLRVEKENAAAMVSAHEDTEAFVQNITLLGDELATEHQAQEASEREHRA